jgi:hypothetical protein
VEVGGKINVCDSPKGVEEERPKEQETFLYF